MKLVYEGKTKNKYVLEDGNLLLKLKDDATAGEDGVFDPGRNQVRLSISGLGKKSLELSSYYFKKLNAAGVKTHFISSNIDDVSMTVRPAVMIGQGLEVICRLKAAGSFVRRYGAYVTEGQDLNALVEFTLKDDDREDPPASKETLLTLGLVTEEEYEACTALAKRITKILDDDLSSKGLELYDIKYEFGRIDGQIALVDEISGGTMRLFKDGASVSPMEINDYVVI